MYKPNILSAAVAAVLMGSGLANAAEIEKILVTATKRAESSQDIPVAVSALTGPALEQLNVTSFDDYIKYLPNVSRGGRGPGQNEIYIRGMASDASTISVAEAQGSAPTVALYVDEQPVSAGGRNLDMYITDVERIEVLAGPQGTLFGASSQAGTVRIITNKPQLDEFAAGFDFSISNTKSGDMSNSAEVYVNIPLSDKVAVRLAAYNDNQGGYIDNVYGTTTIDPVVANTNQAPFGVFIPADGSISIETADNRELVEENFNDASYQGYRFGLKYEIFEDWSLLLQHTAQDLNVDGVFDYDPAVGDLQVQRFFKDELTDKIGLTTWTLEGRLSALDLVYTGGFVDREVSQGIDYTGYNNVGSYIGTYTCNYDASYVATKCHSPIKAFTNEIDSTRQTHEFRINTDSDNRVRLTAGVFYDDQETNSDGTFLYLGTADALNTGNPQFGHNIRNPLVQSGGDINAITLIDPTARLPGEGFINDIRRSEEQIALFAEVSFNITDKLTSSVGLRAYEIEVDLDGWAGGGFSGPGRNLDVNAAALKSDDVIGKLNFSYKYDEDMLFYATYSEGFRPPGVNRAGGEAANRAEYGTIPEGFGSDEVENVEFGWKTDLLDGTLRWNGTIYSVDWTNIQVARFDPTNLTITTFLDNSLDAKIFGLETDFIYLLSDSLTMFGAMSYNDTEVTAIGSSIFADQLPPLGSPLPLTPKYQFSLRLRDELELGSYYGFWQVGMVYADETTSALLLDDALPQAAYTVWDLSAGISKDDWRAEIFIENATDERANLHFNSQDDVPRITTNRPRTIGLRVSYDFE